MEILVVIIFGALASFIASTKGRNGLTWFVIGGVTTIIGIAILLFLPNLKKEYKTSPTRNFDSSFNRVKDNIESKNVSDKDSDVDNNISDELKYYYNIMGCKPSDSNDDIKARYKELVKKFHPDSLSSKDVDPAFTQFAASKFNEVREAFEHIKEARNIV